MTILSLDMVGKTIGFEVYPLAKLGDKFKNVKLETFLDYNTAKLFEDIDSLAVNVYPTLPPGTPKEYRDYIYVKVKHPDGATSILATNWINTETLKINQETILNVRVVVNSLESMETLRKVLVGSGFTNFDISYLAS